MNIALIFAGGVGKRMNISSLPKQFLEVDNIPIIVHTISKFQNNSTIDGIVVVIVAEYFQFMIDLINKYNLSKVKSVVIGGKSGQESIFNGLKEIVNIYGIDGNIVLIHDGVRPLIDDETITKNVECVKENGNAVTVTESIETIVLLDENGVVDKVMDRNRCNLARAPQSFYLKDIYQNHLKSINEKKTEFIDSAMLMQHYGSKIYTVKGPIENIKVTTTMDYYLLKALLESKKSSE